MRDALFDSDARFHFGTGWLSSDCENTDGRLIRIEDRRHGVVCTEARCAACHHLGHVFADQPTATGERYCMNSASPCLGWAKS